MIENLETLAALRREGTMIAAATRLHLTQSAVSKRIAQLESDLGFDVIEKEGRRVRFTPQGLRLLERVTPVLSELRSVLHEELVALPEGRLVLGVAESVLESWGARALARAARRLPRLELAIHAHRSAVVLDRVRSGEYMLGICTVPPSRESDLRTERILDEEMVLVPAGLRKTRERHWNVIGIERGSATGEGIAEQLRKLPITVVRPVQSFACVVQMAREGLGHGLAPIGIVRSMGVPISKCVRLPLARTVSWVARSSTWARPAVRAFQEAFTSFLAPGRSD